ncbi:MAG: hypothetical protein GY810_04690 [Aureispira sp.]|nr:hypothetical protein [Aureispira sp.]
MRIIFLFIFATYNLNAQLYKAPNPEFAPPPKVKMMLNKHYNLDSLDKFSLNSIDKFFFNKKGLLTKFEAYSKEGVLELEKEYKFDATGKEIGWRYTNHKQNQSTEENYDFDAPDKNENQFFFNKKGLLSKNIAIEQEEEDTTCTTYYYNNDNRLSYISIDRQYTFYGCSQTEAYEKQSDFRTITFNYNTKGQLEEVKDGNQSRKFHYHKKGYKTKTATYNIMPLAETAYTTHKYTFWK